MAHLAKFTKGAMGHMLSHFDRSKKNLGDNVNQDRTYLNYNLAEHQQMKQLDFIHKRLSEVKLQNRKDVNVLCDWVVTIPKDFLAKYPDREREFFEATYKFLENKYGKDNVVSAYVHRDETTPHLHFAFIPVVPDKKKGGYKVSAKEAVTRNDLKRFHPQLSDYLLQTMGVQVNVLNEATKEGNKSIEELKRNTAVKEMEKLKSELENIKSQIKDNKEYMSIYDKTQVKPIKYNRLPQMVEKIVGKNLVLVDKEIIDRLNKQLRGLFTKETAYFDVLHKAQAEAVKIIGKAREQGIAEAQVEADKIYKQNKKDVDNYTMSKMQDIADREQMLNNKIEGLEGENKELKAELDYHRPRSERLSDLEGRWKRLVEVSEAEKYPDQVKDYINSGDIPKLKDKGLEL